MFQPLQFEKRLAKKRLLRLARLHIDAQIAQSLKFAQFARQRAAIVPVNQALMRLVESIFDKRTQLRSVV